MRWALRIPLSVRTLLAVALLSFAPSGCARFGSESEEDEAQSGEAVRGSLVRGLLLLSPEQLQAAGVELATAGPGTLDIAIVLPGEIELDPGQVAHVVPPVSGLVRAAGKRVGDPVRAGETLLVLESSELAKAKSEYLTRQKVLELAQIDLERAGALQANTAAALQALDA